MPENPVQVKKSSYTDCAIKETHLELAFLDNKIFNHVSFFVRKISYLTAKFGEIFVADVQETFAVVVSNVAAPDVS